MYVISGLCSARARTPRTVIPGQQLRDAVLSFGQCVAKATMLSSVTSAPLSVMSTNCGQPLASLITPSSDTAGGVKTARSSNAERRPPVWRL
jgi:hypothetical protein